jgi:ABC-2 type transport system permease protein
MRIKRYIFTTWAMTVLLTRRYMRSKTALFFSVLFPLILLFVFGGLFGSSSGTTFKVAVIDDAHTSFSQQYTAEIGKESVFKVTPVSSLSDAESQMQKSELDAIIQLPTNFGKANVKGYPTGQAVVLYDQNSATAGQTVASIIGAGFAATNAQITRITPPLTVVTKSTEHSGLTAFDYAFTGLLGFSLLGLGIFGPINTLPALKKTGALARLRTTPLTAMQFIISYAASSIVAGALSIGVMFAVAVVVFHFRVNGNLLIFSLYALLGAILMFGFGMAVGGWANDEKQAAPLGNLVSFPMLFLSGVFFPRYLMPLWLQHVTAFVPLSPVIDGLRMISTQNKGFFDLGPQLAIMGGWMVIIYIIAFMIFRWE